jgi:hypothetical protein
MFRKTFIRLFLVAIVATTSLLVFAATQQEPAKNDSQVCKESGSDCESGRTRSEFMILESIGRTILGSMTN